MAITGTFAMPEPAHMLTLQGEYVMPYDAAGPTILTASLPNAGIGLPYSAQAEASGTGPFVWSATGLPAGITLSPSGAFGGSWSGGAGTSNVTLTVVDAGGAQSSAVVAISGGTAPDITATTIPAATLGVYYSHTIPVTGTITGSSLAGDLPVGIAFDAGSRTLSGTPTLIESRPLLYTVSNAYGSDSVALVFTVNASVASSTVGGWGRFIR